MSSIIDSLFQPGLNAPMQRLMNFSFAGLLLVLFALAILTGGNLHVVALFGIAVALWGSVGWFLKELAKLPPPPSEKEKEQARSGRAGAEGQQAAGLDAVDGREGKGSGAGESKKVR